MTEPKITTYKDSKYSTQRTSIHTSPKTWDKQFVEILCENVKIGEYEYNYHSGCPFFPFSLNGKDYALYSKDYTATRVMRLPECTDLCGESGHNFGFCPVEYLVASFPYRIPKEFLPFGFIAGCCWGDDSSWKIQFLDLSRIEEGILTRDSRFGYIELPNDMNLSEAIEVCEDFDSTYPKIDISCRRRFDLSKDADDTTQSYPLPKDLKVKVIDWDGKDMWDKIPCEEKYTCHKCDKGARYSIGSEEIWSCIDHLPLNSYISKY